MPIDPDDAAKKNRAFIRVGSPSSKTQPFLTGQGHDRSGTRHEDDFPASFLLDLLMRKTILLAPSWAKTEVAPKSNAVVAERAAEQELFGTLGRSFQTWTDAPGIQWHRWYDWNFHVEPAPNFDWLRGAANRIEQNRSGAAQLIKGAMECEWDTGAFGDGRPGP